MRPAGPADLAGIADFLDARIETSMFPRANLAAQGPDDGGAGHPLAMRFWVAGAPLRAVLGRSRGGMVMPQFDPVFAPAAARALAGLPLSGVVGETAQVRALIAAADLQDAPAKMDEDEPQFLLELAAMTLPDCTGLQLVPARAAPRDLLIRWRADYDIEIMGGRPGEAEAQAAATLDGWLAADSHRVLLRAGQPVALTGFNAQRPEIVQIGGVWTPPDLRGQGLARRAVGLHLAEARAAGAARATLFSASEQASRAYMALGFRQIGRFTLVLFDGAQQVADV